MHTVGSGVCRENLKSWEKRNTHGMTWNMVRNAKNVGKKKCTLQDLEYGEKHSKHGKLEMYTVGLGIWLEILKNVENKKGPGVCREN